MKMLLLVLLIVLLEITQTNPAAHQPADKISKELGSRGFKIVGSTVVCAHMQATSMINHHVSDFPPHAEAARIGA